MKRAVGLRLVHCPRGHIHKFYQKIHNNNSLSFYALILSYDKRECQ
jgi:hypothetical protein